MDDLKKTFREANQGARETTRDIDGHDTSDDVGNIGDAARKNLGNLGDDVKKGADRTFNDDKVSDRNM